MTTEMGRSAAIVLYVVFMAVVVVDADLLFFRNAEPKLPSTHEGRL